MSTSNQEAMCILWWNIAIKEILLIILKEAPCWYRKRFGLGSYSFVWLCRQYTTCTSCIVIWSQQIFSCKVATTKLSWQTLVLARSFQWTTLRFISVRGRCPIAPLRLSGASHRLKRRMCGLWVASCTRCARSGEPMETAQKQVWKTVSLCLMCLSCPRIVNLICVSYIGVWCKNAKIKDLQSMKC